MFDWSSLLTSIVVNGIITVTISSLFKYKFDKKLDAQKFTFEKERLDINHQMQKELEFLKSEIGHVSILNQKNIEHFQSLNQAVQSRKIEALETVWNLYLNIRISISPILNLFSIYLPNEYLNKINKIHENDSLGLKSIDNSDDLVRLDTVPLLRKLEEQRPFLGEVMYYKFRSSIVILKRLKLMYLNMLKENTTYNWCDDTLLIDHFKVVFSTDTISEGHIPFSLDSPLKLLSVIGLVEFEITKTMDGVLSGEVIADISLERAMRLYNGFS
ncbi:hypothetical protein [Paenibacillus taichungensis]|uniref:hypothetical protein n=1 Tax=Paenibacillus taichungensis TaxID=484184 RepID=UPI0039A09414